MKRRNFTHALGHTYDGPRMRNPFFMARTPLRVLRYLVLGMCVAACVGVPTAFVFAPFMRYNAVVVNGLSTLSSDEIVAAVHAEIDRRHALIIPGQHIFFTSLDNVITALNAQFHFANLTATRAGRTLVLTAQERITEVAWTTDTHTYFIDLDGIAVREATPEAIAMIAARRAQEAVIPAAPGVQPTMPIIDAEDTETIVLGAPVVAADRLAHVLALDAGLRARGINPVRYNIETATTAWVRVTTASTPQLLFDISTPPDTALSMYDAFVNDHTTDLRTLAYIDLRFGNHIYTKQQ